MSSLSITLTRILFCGRLRSESLSIMVFPLGIWCSICLCGLLLVLMCFRCLLVCIGEFSLALFFISYLRLRRILRFS